MKTNPTVLAALLVVAVFVSGVFSVAAQHAARAGEAWFAGARSTAKQEITWCLVKAGTGALVRWAKS